MRPWAVLFALLLLAVPGAPQSPGQANEVPEDLDAVYAPVQTVVDAFPELVRLAVTESLLDGTPDAAATQAARMQAFAAVFQLEQAWPEEALASRVEAREAFHHAIEAANVASAIVPETGVAARTTAACTAWQGNVTFQSAARWQAEHRSAASSLTAAAEAIGRLAAGAPAGVDPAPYEAALALLRPFRDHMDDVGGVCLDALVDRLPSEPVSFEVPGVAGGLWFQIVPERTWPGGTVEVQGMAGSGPVRVDGAVLETADLPVRSGGFRESFVVHPSALPGTYAVTVTVDGLEARRWLEVVRAPLGLEAEAPAQVALGEAVRISVRGTGPGVPLLPQDASIHASGALVDEAPFPGTAWFEWTPSNAGSHDVRIAYPGDERVRPASTDVRVLVVGATATVNATEASGQEPRGGALERFLRGTGEPPVAWYLLLFVLLPLLAAAAHVLWRRRPRAEAGPRWPVPEVAFGQRARAPRGFVQAVAAFVLWLIGRGELRPSATARDAARHLESRGYRAHGLVARFEAIRYGPEREGPAERKGATWLEWVRRRWT